MNYTELIDILEAMLPNLIGLLFVTGMLASAYIAVRTSPGEPAADRHFVLLLSLGGVGAVFLAGIVLRALLGVPWTGDVVTPDGLLVGLGMAWGCGLLVLIARLAIGMVAIARLRAPSNSVEPGEAVHGLIRECARQLGLYSTPRVVFSRRCTSPLTTGATNPVVLLPDSMLEADEQELRFVLTHEFAHVRRKDCLAELMVQVMGALLWWNPLYWMVASRLRVLREMVCDQIVSYECRFPERYAELLVRFAVRSLLPFGPGFATIRMADKRSLHARIDHLVHGTRIRDDWFPRFLPTTMSNMETLRFTLFVVFVLVSFDAMFLSSLEEFSVDPRFFP